MSTVTTLASLPFADDHPEFADLRTPDFTQLDSAADERSVDGQDPDTEDSLDTEVSVDDHEELSDEWLTWCSDAGRSAVPILVELHDRVPHISAAMLCTLDGFNICAIGIDENAVGRAAAVASSLHAVGAAATGQGRARGSFDYLTVVSGSQTTVFTAVEHAQLGQLLLWARAEGEALGVLLLAVRTSAARVSNELAHLTAALPSG
jgi:predicted regulator of Ras-like GTPase activity (Roadblock/LC7/MglB family)